MDISDRRLGAYQSLDKMWIFAWSQQFNIVRTAEWFPPPDAERPSVPGPGWGSQLQEQGGFMERLRVTSQEAVHPRVPASLPRCVE